MKIAYNPKTAAALTAAPSNNDITFDLKGLNIFVRGEKFKGTDTTYSVFKKHTSASSGGYNGLVPVPSYTTTLIRFLREDGTWLVPIDNKVLLSNTTTDNYRPLVLGTTYNTDTSSLATSITGLVYVNTKIYALPSTGNIYATYFKGLLSGVISSATTATTLATSDNSTKVATTAFVKAAISANLTTTDAIYVKKAGDTMTGKLTINSDLSVTGLATVNGYITTSCVTIKANTYGSSRPTTGISVNGLRGSMATNDFWAIFGYGTGSDLGYMEIATGDGGNEPIYCGLYSNGAPWSGNATRSHGITLMDASGNLVFNTVTATGYKKSGSSDSYLLLGGGGHKAISDFMLKTEELTTNLTTITKSLTVTQAWMDTGITSTNLPANGTYIVQVKVSANDSTGSMYDCISSGVMSWHRNSTNDVETDEIILHRSGHAYHKTIYLRTVMLGTGVLKLLIGASLDIGNAYDYTFKFKRII